MKLRELSIIQYQNVSIRDHLDKLWISVDSFKKQLEYIISNNFQVLSINDAIDYMERKRRTRDLRPISLTFDNGYMDFYEYVIPLISKHGLPVTVLISPEKVGKSGRLRNLEERQKRFSFRKFLSSLRFPLFPVFATTVLWKARNYGGLRRTLTEI